MLTEQDGGATGPAALQPYAIPLSPSLLRRLAACVTRRYCLVVGRLVTMIPWEGLARTKRKAVGRALDRADDDAAGIEKVQSTTSFTLLCLLCGPGRMPALASVVSGRGAVALASSCSRSSGVVVMVTVG